MQVTRAGHGKIAPVDAARAARRRESGTAPAEPVNPQRPKSKALAVLRDRPARDVPRAPIMSVPLTAQMIAQNIPTKSDRRLARLFPESALAAYRSAAAVRSQPAPTATRSA